MQLKKAYRKGESRVTKFISEKSWKPVEAIIYGEDSVELDVVKLKNNCLVSAGPGAGKTELLAQKTSFLLETNTCSYPRKVLALSYKVDSATNIKERVDRRCGVEMGKRFISKTYDSFAKSILDQFSYLLPDFYKVSAEYDIATTKDIEDAYNACTLPKDFELTDFYKYDYLTENAFPVIDTPYGDIARKVLPVLLRGSKKFKAKLSFKIISRLAELIIKENPVLMNSFGITYSYVFLDEFQDTPRHHYDLIKACFHKSGSIVTAVGDKKQRIMTWAGAMNNAFDIFVKEFEAEEKILFANHRSAPHLIKLQNVIAESMLGAKVDIKISDKWGSNNGESQLWVFDNENQEGKYIASHIKNLISENSISIKDICILCRKRPDEYSNVLIKQFDDIGIGARVEDKYQTLLKEDIVKLILSIIKLAVKRDSPDNWISVTSTLKRLRGFTGNTEVGRISKFEEDFSKVLISIKERLSNISNKELFGHLINDIVSYLNIEQLKALYSQYKRGNYVNNILKELKELLWLEYDECKEWLTAIDKFYGEYTIPIMTIHKSKGLEYNTVILLGLEDSAFWGIDENYDEELCNFFVALSRAKERMYFTFSKNRKLYGKVRRQTKDNVDSFYKLMKKSEVVRLLNLSSKVTHP